MVHMSISVESWWGGHHFWWFHSMFQPFLDDDPGQCYQTHQTYQQNSPRPGLQTYQTSVNSHIFPGFWRISTRTLGLVGACWGLTSWAPNQGLEQRASGLSDCRAQRQIGWGRPGDRGIASRCGAFGDIWTCWTCGTSWYMFIRVCTRLDSMYDVSDQKQGGNVNVKWIWFFNYIRDCRGVESNMSLRPVDGLPTFCMFYLSQT